MPVVRFTASKQHGVQFRRGCGFWVTAFQSRFAIGNRDLQFEAWRCFQRSLLNSKKQEKFGNSNEEGFS
jgi:hypothetical protein